MTYVPHDLPGEVRDVIERVARSRGTILSRDIGCVGIQYIAVGFKIWDTLKAWAESEEMESFVIDLTTSVTLFGTPVKKDPTLAGDAIVWRIEVSA